MLVNGGPTTTCVYSLLYFQNLSSNKLRSKGAEVMKQIILTNINIHTLTLADNGFREFDAQPLSDALQVDIICIIMKY